MKKAIETFRRVDTCDAKTAACGWNAATPRPPSMRRAKSAPKLGARPSPLMKTAAVRGPNATNQGRSMRSEMRPKSGCEKEEVMDESATRVPTRVRLRWSLCTKSGRSGEKKLEYESIVR